MFTHRLVIFSLIISSSLNAMEDAHEAPPNPAITIVKQNNYALTYRQTRVALGLGTLLTFVGAISDAGTISDSFTADGLQQTQFICGSFSITTRMLLWVLLMKIITQTGN